jgi:TRAP transporter TAXI family solute receptor
MSPIQETVKVPPGIWCERTPAHTLVTMSRPKLPARLRTLALLAAAALATVAGGCAGPTLAPPATLYIATGNTSGVYYQLGGGYADLINAYLPGWQAEAETTGASVDNVLRVARGDADIGFTQADVAADAVAGTRSFSSRQPIRALARIYNDYVHVIVRTDMRITRVYELKGRRISTGSPNSGTERIAIRLLQAAGLDPDRDVVRQSISLPETVQALKDGSTDAMVWSGGLPTGGVADLLAAMGDKVAFLQISGLLGAMQARYGDVYQPATIPKQVYDINADVGSIAVPNLLVVKDTMPDRLAHDLTKLLFDHLNELAKVHPEARNIRRDTASDCGQVQVHPGAAAYYGGV